MVMVFRVRVLRVRVRVLRIRVWLTRLAMLTRPPHPCCNAKPFQELFETLWVCVVTQTTPAPGQTI